MKKLSVLVVLLCGLASVNMAQNANKTYRVDISDEYLASSIVGYVEENKIDVKCQVIILKIVTGRKKTVTITNEISALYKTSPFVPTNYGSLSRNIVFFVYASVDNLFKRDFTEIRREVDDCLRTLSIHLEAVDEGVLHKTYSAAIWRLTEESNGYRLNKHVTPY